MLEKWINDYIDGIDITNIRWINLDSSMLDEFIKDNYYDEVSYEYVCDKDATKIYPTLLGMEYLNLTSPNIDDYDYNYILGIVDNKIGKKTIVACMIYIDRHFMFKSQNTPFTYISTVEVNSYFRNMGIYKRLCEESISYFNIDQPVLTTIESDIGKECHTFEIFRDVLKTSGFENEIWQYDFDIHKNVEFRRVIQGLDKELVK